MNSMRILLFISALATLLLCVNCKSEKIADLLIRKAREAVLHKRQAIPASPCSKGPDSLPTDNLETVGCYYQPKSVLPPPNLNKNFPYSNSYSPGVYYDGSNDPSNFDQPPRTSDGQTFRSDEPTGFGGSSFPSGENYGWESRV